MIITRQQQEKLVANYVKEKRSTDECVGFIDGINAALEMVDQRLKKENELPCIVCNGTGKR